MMQYLLESSLHDKLLKHLHEGFELRCIDPQRTQCLRECAANEGCRACVRPHETRKDFAPEVCGLQSTAPAGRHQSPVDKGFRPLDQAASWLQDIQKSWV